MICSCQPLSPQTGRPWTRFAVIPLLGFPHATLELHRPRTLQPLDHLSKNASAHTHLSSHQEACDTRTTKTPSPTGQVEVISTTSDHGGIQTILPATSQPIKRAPASTLDVAERHLQGLTDANLNSVVASGLFRAEMPGTQSGINTVSKIRQSTLSLLFKDISASTTSRPSHAARPTKSTTTVMRSAPLRSAAAEMVAIPSAAVALDSHPLPLVRTRTMTPAMTTETQPSTHCCVCSSDAGCPRPIRPFRVLWSQGRSEVQVRQSSSPAQVTNMI